MGWDRDAEALLPSTNKLDHPAYISFGCLPIFYGTERDAYTFYTGQKYLRIATFYVVLVGCSLPIIALFMCITIALLFHFNEATNTHCRVENVLPSISTVIGGFPETTFIWSSLIYLHFIPRLLPLLSYHQTFRLRLNLKSFLKRSLLRSHLALGFIELAALLSLTYYNSDYNHEYHVISFSIFGTSSLLYAFAHCLLFKLTQMDVQSKGHILSWRMKRRTFSMSVGCLLMCAYLFYRHNTYCEPFVFSVFAFFEYVFVLSNIAFHSTFRFDFSDCSLYIS
ncbi:unnamed protein product, partial [Mesorhabditis belari]|uniref:CWH43-like N-terminal domain-containing protein n=1 Tax=Mesorhabditis belari TaxID=2138241 RepID=A0AAF3EBM1_9BILA